MKLESIPLAGEPSLPRGSSRLARDSPWSVGSARSIVSARSVGSVATVAITVVLLVSAASVGVGADATVASATTSDVAGAPIEPTAEDGGFTDILRTDDGYLLVGWLEEQSGLEHGWVVKTDRSGSVVWERTLASAEFARFLSVERGADGGYVVAGTVAAGERTDGWMVALDPDGTTKWERRFGDQDSSEGFREVVPAHDGGYVLAGFALENGDSHGLALHLDEDGRTPWVREYAPDGRAGSFYTAVRSDDGYLFAGEAGGAGWTTTVETNGLQRWSRTLDDGTTTVYHAVQGEDGTLLAGEAEGADRTTNGRVVSLAADGTTRWTRSPGGAHDDRFLTAIRADDGGALLVGVTNDSSEGTGQGWAVMYGPDGDRGWEITYGGAEGWDAIWSVARGHGSSYVFASKSESAGVSVEALQLLVEGGSTTAIDDPDGASGGVTVAIDGSPVESVTLETDNGTGVVSVGERDRPSDAAELPGQPVHVVDVTVPHSLQEVSGSLVVRVAEGDVPASLDASRLAVYRQTADGWTRADTTVVDETGDNATLRADVDGFSTVAVTLLEPPRARADVPGTVQVGETVTLSAASQSDDVAASTYRWNADGQSLQGRSVEATFTEPGEQSVDLVVRDATGLVDRTSATVVVNDRPELALDVPETTATGERVQLQVSVDDEVGDTRVQWSVDGETLNGTAVAHVFDEPGDHVVSVEVVDEHGATASREVTVTVESSPPADLAAPGLGTLAGVLALGIALLWIVRFR